MSRRSDRIPQPKKRSTLQGRKLLAALENPWRIPLGAAATFGLWWLAARSEALSPQGPWGDGQEILVWCLLGSILALHRPWGGATLGLGALVLPIAALRLGTAPAALVAAGTFLLSRVTLAVVRRHLGRLREVWGPARTLAQTLAATGAALAGSWITVQYKEDSLPAVFLLAPLAYALGFLLLAPGPDEPAGERRVAVVLDAMAWPLGVLFHSTAEGAGWPLVGVLLTAFALLAAEAARNGMLRGVSDHRAHDLQRVQQAHARILGETSGMADIAQQILIECGNVMPVSWYQFELLPGTGREGQSWAAGPDGLLEEGVPYPPAHPEMLPGIHRRAHWHVLEHRLEGEEEELAAVRLWCDPRRIAPEAETLLLSLVPQMASSVHRAHLDREAKLDPLTGVPVRRLLESRLQKAFLHCLEEGASMAVIMCDIDFFKKVNDTYGHDAGDQALILVAKTLDSERRENDLCCRYGGEEFTFLLEETNGTDALRFAERLRAAVEALTMVYEERSVPLTLSLGVAAFPELHIKTASELLLLADEALYQAKKRGRNQAFLNLGWGRFRSPDGDTAIDPEIAAKAGPPRIFG